MEVFKNLRSKGPCATEKPGNVVIVSVLAVFELRTLILNPKKVCTFNFFLYVTDVMTSQAVNVFKVCESANRCILRLSEYQ